MRRVVLLGASNLTLALPLVVETVRRAGPGPAEILCADGHGRSFGIWSRVLGRALPGIADCGLWAALERAGPASVTWALVTDIGNDLLYGVAPDRISRWVEECVARLADGGAAVTLAGLPVASIERVGPARYRAARRLLFPRADLPWAAMREAVRRLDDAVAAIAERHAARRIAPAADWYGLDPIHVRRRRRAAAWRTLLEEGAPGRALPVAPPPWPARVAIWRLRPAERTMLGRLQRAAQPARRWADGSSLALY